ncbi:MAG TPA: hypothetical protein VGL02_24245 [Streptomyces sp.]
MNTLLNSLITPTGLTDDGPQYGPVPALTTEQLLQLHTELVEHADFISWETETALECASVVRAVLRNLKGNSDTPVEIPVGSSAHSAVRNIITALRFHRGTHRAEIARHLELARGWVADLAIHAEKTPTTSSDPWGVEPC